MTTGAPGSARASRRTPPRARRVALAALSGGLYAAAFPPTEASALAFVALVPLVVALLPTSEPRSPRASSVAPSRLGAFALGWICCTIAGTLLVGLSVYEAAVRYFGLAAPIAASAAVLVPQVYGAPFFALFALVTREILARDRSAATTAIAIAACWTATELLRSCVGDGLPWLLLAHSQTSRPWLLQTADLAGASGPTFVVALVNAAIAMAILDLGRNAGDARARHTDHTLHAGRARATTATPGRSRSLLTRIARLAPLAAVVFAGVGSAALYGRVQLARWSPDEGGDRLRVALIQGNLPDAWRYSLASLPAALERMSELTRSAASTEPDLIVWPENAVSISVDANAGAFRSLTTALPATGLLLIGAPRAVATAPGRAALRNSAFLLDGSGAVLGTYDKQLLTPWAEAAPWPLTVMPLLRSAPAPSAYTPGGAPELLEIRAHRFAVLICSEAIYPSLARAAARDGAEMLVIIGNDGWFGTRPAGAQHLDAVILRAVEIRRPVVRATTSGITALIDPRGIVTARAPQNEATTLLGDVRPIPDRGATFYAKFGDIFGWTCGAIALAALLPRRRARAPRGG